jgi:hypothetical protein
MDQVFLNQSYDEALASTIKRLSENNIKLQKKVELELIKFKFSRKVIKNKTQQRLYYKSIQTIQDNLQTDLALQLLTFRLRQFALWFSYMWNNPTLCKKTLKRLQKKYPFKDTRFLRQFQLKI